MGVGILHSIQRCRVTKPFAGGTLYTYVPHHAFGLPSLTSTMKAKSYMACASSLGESSSAPGVQIMMRMFNKLLFNKLHERKRKPAPYHPTEGCE